MGFSIQTKPALLGMETKPARLSWKSEQPVVELESQNVELNIQSTLPKIKIDQSQCFSESGLKSINELNAENAQRAVSDMYQSIGRIVEQGNELTNFYSGGNVIADQGYNNAYTQFDKDFNMVTMPKSRPKITLEPGEVKMDPTTPKVIATPRLSKIDFQYQPGKVDIYLRQKPEISMEYTPKLDMKV